LLTNVLGDFIKYHAKPAAIAMPTIKPTNSPTIKGLPLPVLDFLVAALLIAVPLHVLWCGHTEQT
jgi:hypothetical protein